MDNDLLRIVAQVAGIGGLGLGVLLIVFRNIVAKTIFPMLTKGDAYRLLRLISILAFLVAAIAIAAWVWTNSPEADGGQTIVIDGDGNSATQQVGSD